MARKKRLDTELVLGQSKSISYKKTKDEKITGFYNVGLYVRLSVEDSGKIDGYSLENQIALLENFISDKDELCLHKKYVDNGQSGTTFERPAFNEMMADIRAGIINCVIVKDLSRLGRDYLETGQYIEQIFPFFYTRFISVMDNYDSVSSSAMDDGMLIPLKNIINDSYAKDISKKVSTALEVKQKQGVFLGNYPPYGYQKDPENSGHLIVDEQVADIVRQMFRWKADGMSNWKIAKTLNDQGVLSPYRYFYSIGLLKTEGYKDSLWTRTLVKRLLEKRYYIGDMISGKEKTSLVEGLHKQKVEEEDWIIVEGTHEAIVSKELFFRVQDKIAEDKEKYNTTNRYEDFHVENLFAGKLRCGTCGSAMKLMRIQRKNTSGTISRKAEYICSDFAEHKFDKCKRVKISKTELDMTVFEEIKTHIMLFANAEQVVRLLNSTPRFSTIYSDYDNQIQKRTSRLHRIESLNSGIYEDFKEDIIDEEEYLSLRKNYSEEERELKKQIEHLQCEKEKYSPTFQKESEYRQLIERYFESQELSRDMVESFIENVTVFDDKRIRITYRFQDEFQNMIDELTKRKGEMANDECSKSNGFHEALCYWDVYSSLQRG